MGLVVAGGGTAGGYGTCQIDPSNSTATLQHNVTLASAFVGPVYVTDPCNTTNLNGYGNYVSNANNFDWFGFSDVYRGWGQDKASALTQSNCSSSQPNCRIFDYSLSASDSTIRGILPQPSDGNQVVTHTWSNGSSTTFLINAYEIFGDGLGNDNWLCETNEACVYTPNMGAYQGHGPLVPVGTIGAGGTVQNIALQAYSVNGY